jgi:pimeloyl-ACP methyl ester carboxylesterase
MAEVDLGDVRIAYEVSGEGEPVVLICGCGQPAIAWHLGLVPALTAAGYQVITFDNRGMAPSSSPPAP